MVANPSHFTLFANLAMDLLGHKCFVTLLKSTLKANFRELYAMSSHFTLFANLAMDLLGHKCFVTLLKSTLKAKTELNVYGHVKCVEKRLVPTQVND
jgi:hypothetical protein